MRYSVTFDWRHSCQIWNPVLAPVSRYWENSDGGISGFWISGQSLIKENCHNFRTSNNIDMKLGPVTKLEKKIYDDVMSANCDFIVIFPISGQFGAIRKSDSGHLFCKIYIFIISNLLSYKNWKQNQKTFNTVPTLLLWVQILFLAKNADLLQKM